MLNSSFIYRFGYFYFNSRVKSSGDLFILLKIKANAEMFLGGGYLRLNLATIYKEAAFPNNKITYVIPLKVKSLIIISLWFFYNMIWYKS